jgi:hypothetical protein
MPFDTMLTVSRAFQLLRQHGFYLRQAHPAKPNGPPLTYRQLLPILSFASTPLHADVLLPAVGIEGVLDRPAADEPAWREKAGKLYWRGSATGMQNEGRPTAVGEGPRQRPWEAAHRPRLDRFANPRPSDGEIGDDGALYADPLNGRPSWAPTLAPEATNGSHRHASRPASRPQRPSTASISGVWKTRWLDVHLAAGRWWRLFAWWPEKGQQCSWADGSCSALAYVLFCHARLVRLSFNFYPPADESSPVATATRTSGRMPPGRAIAPSLCSTSTVRPTASSRPPATNLTPFPTRARLPPPFAARRQRLVGPFPAADGLTLARAQGDGLYRVERRRLPCPRRLRARQR